MIRTTTPNDLKVISQIYRRVTLDRKRLKDSKYRTAVQKSGFLVGGDSKKETEELIRKATLALVYERGKRILGFVIVGTEREYQENGYQRWFDKRIKDVYFKSPRSVSLLSIVVDPEAHTKGIGSLLYRHLERELKKQSFKHLFAVITISPLTNCPSLIFHAKHGFEGVAMELPGTVFGIQNYSSVLIYKLL